MATFTRSDDLHAAQFIGADLSDARFVDSDLSGVVMRAVDLRDADLDAPWLLDGETSLIVNGVDVAPLVEAELNRRFSGRAERRAEDPDGLRAAWDKLADAWAAAVRRAAAMPPGTVDVSVDGEWSFAQTLRHLIFATDAWLGRAVLEREDPFHPIGQPRDGAEEDGLDLSFFRKEPPPYAEVLEVRAERQAMVRDYLAAATPETLDEQRANPWSPAYPETVRSCLHTILEEEWEHLRYALRDLDSIETKPDE